MYIRLFFKYPETYISAFLNQTSTYAYLGQYNTIAYWDLKDTYITKGLTDHSKNKTIKKIDKNIEGYYKVIMSTPGISLLFDIGFYFWISILMFIESFNKKKIKEIMPLIPMIVSTLFLFVSPVSANQRYVMPIGCLAIVLAPYFVKIYNERGRENEKAKRRN